MDINILGPRGEWKEKHVADLKIGNVFAHPGSPVAHYVTHVFGPRGGPTDVGGYELTISDDRVAALKIGLEDATLEGYFDLILQRCFIGRILRFRA